jgi:hypothetical protein
MTNPIAHGTIKLHHCITTKHVAALKIQAIGFVKLWMSVYGPRNLWFQLSRELMRNSPTQLESYCQEVST